MDSLQGYYHQDGEWDVSINTLNDDLNWANTLTLITEDGTKITLSHGGNIKIEGNFTVHS